MEMRLVTLTTLIALVGFSAGEAFSDAKAFAYARSCRKSEICGLNAPEDLVRVGEGSILASRLGGSGLDVISVVERRVRAIDLKQMAQASDAFYGCPALEAPDNFVSHGLSIKPHKDGHNRLYVVRHGGREAVEIFEFGQPADVESLRWVGCVPLPDGFEGNAVVGRRDGGFFVSSMFDPGKTAEVDKRAKLYAAHASGAVLEWRPGRGFRPLLADSISGPNGLELSSDERRLYVAGWASRDISEINLIDPESPPRRLRVDFMPDNLRWADSGMLMVAGMHAKPGPTFECAMTAKPNQRCTTHWSVVGIDTAQMKRSNEISRDADPGFGDVSVALTVGDDLWLGSFSGDRVAIVSGGGRRRDAH